MSLAVRVELARRLTKSCLSSRNLAQQLQICLFHHGVNPKFRTEVVRLSGRVMNRNKQNKVSCEWRPVSTQSNSSQRKMDLFVADGAKNEVEIQGEQVDVASSSRFPLDDKKTTFQLAENVRPFAVTSSIGKHSSSIQVCSSLVRFIRGKEGVTQKEIEQETGVQIILPSPRKEDSIIIEGGSAESVRRASARILAIIDEVVKSPNLDYSHFISLPLAIHPELVDKLDKFRNSVLGIPKASELGIDKSIFINPKTFHLTVLMLKLWNKNLVKAADQVLQSVSEKVIQALDARPLSIRLKGLECMKGSFPKARVLYAPIEEIGGEERLSRACQIIIDAFLDAGLVLERDAKHKLKFHATVMNVRHRKSYRNHRKRYNDSFDARTIADQYGSEDWGEYLIREAHLSERFAFDEKGCLFAELLTGKFLTDDFSYVMQLLTSFSLPMVLYNAVNLNLFEIVAKAGDGLKLSPTQIAVLLLTKNPDAASTLDRILRLLITYSMFTCDEVVAGIKRFYGLALINYETTQLIPTQEKIKLSNQESATHNQETENANHPRWGFGQRNQEANFGLLEVKGNKVTLDSILDYMSRILDSL